jgi:zinc transporter ZupT
VSLGLGIGVQNIPEGLAVAVSLLDDERDETIVSRPGLGIFNGRLWQ